MERAAKLRRLEEFRRTRPHCSASALGRILTDIKTHGLPELTDRVSMREGRGRVAHLVTPYGCILKPMSVADKTGVMDDLHIACPPASLTYALEESDGLRSLFKHRLTMKPSSPEEPWTIVLYCDEVTPGNPLASVSRRRFMRFTGLSLNLGQKHPVMKSRGSSR